MTTTAKRPQAKSAAGKGARKSTAPMPPAKKSAASKTTGKRVTAAVKTTTKTKRVLPKPGKAAARGASKKSQQASTRATKKAPVKLAPRRLSPEAKTNLAARHLWELVEEKKRRAAQPPAWQSIGHHDHAAPESRTVETTPQNSEPGKFHIGGG